MLYNITYSYSCIAFLLFNTTKKSTKRKSRKMVKRRKKSRREHSTRGKKDVCEKLLLENRNDSHLLKEMSRILEAFDLFAQENWKMPSK